MNRARLATASALRIHRAPGRRASLRSTACRGIVRRDFGIPRTGFLADGDARHSARRSCSGRLPDGGARQPAGRLMAPVKVDPDKVHEFKDADSLLQMARQAPRQGGRGLDQDPQGGFGPEVDHAQGGDRRGALLGLDRRGAQGPRRQELPAALHAARQEEHLEPDQCRQRRAADRGGPDDRAWARGRSRRPRPTGAGTAPTGAART